MSDAPTDTAQELIQMLAEDTLPTMREADNAVRQAAEDDHREVA